MSTDTNNEGPADPSSLNATAAPAEVDIVSVNKKGSSDNKFAKGLFILLVGAMLVALVGWFSQDWLNARKAEVKSNSGPRAAEDTTQVFNPEKTGAAGPRPRLGADSGAVPPSHAAAANAIRPGAAREDGIRPLRGADGKVMVNAQGRAMGVDKNGNVVEVPAITALTDEPQQPRKALPGEATGHSQGAGGAGQTQPMPSRYGGSLFVGDPVKPAPGRGQVSGAPGVGDAGAQAQQIAEILQSAGLGQGGSQTPKPGLGAGMNTPSEQARPGTVGSTLYSSATPVALATSMADQSLILPKGRQADCILTGRIIDEVPGFTSCVLTQNLYSDNGRVLLLERGSELTGEYGITNQLGSERLFVTWTRLKTPEGIQVDLSSPGADALGTSGLPGHLDNRWGARIGAALLLSFVKDISVAIINRQSQSDSSSNTSVSVQSPGQNTMNASSALAEEVIKQTMKVRPRLTINEGDRIAIYVARDLDFSRVYALKTAGVAGATRLLAQ